MSRAPEERITALERHRAPYPIDKMAAHRALLEAWPARRPPGDRPPPPAR